METVLQTNGQPKWHMVALTNCFMQSEAMSPGLCQHLVMGTITPQMEGWDRLAVP